MQLQIDPQPSAALKNGEQMEEGFLAMTAPAAGGWEGLKHKEGFRPRQKTTLA